MHISGICAGYLGYQGKPSPARRIAGKIWNLNLAIIISIDMPFKLTVICSLQKQLIATSINHELRAELTWPSLFHMTPIGSN